MMLRDLNRFRGVILSTITLALAIAAVDAFAYPSARRNTAMVWSDEANGVILFGGLSPLDSANLRYEFGDTWKFIGHRWVRVYPAQAPAPRYGHAMVYDSNRDRIVLFGGAAGETSFDDTWVFENGNWTRLAPPTSPPGRRFPGMAYDSVRDRVVLYGGGVTGGRLFDTWEFDGTTWRLIRAEGPQVENPALVYDAARNEVLMLGTAAGSVVMYRYGSGEWSRITPEKLPACVTQAQMVYRPDSRTVLTYGGSCAFGVSNDTMVWNGQNWTELTLARAAGSLFGYGLAHDPTRNMTVLYGGASTFESDFTFRLSGNRWVVISNLHEPGPRTQFVLQPRLDGEGLLLFGGQSAVDFFRDLWTLEKFEWRQIEGTEASQSSCTSPVSAIDPQREVLVILCGDSSTLEFDGQEWKRVTTPGPMARRFSMMAWDPISRRVIMYGGIDDFGSYVADTWTWNGTEWKKLDLKKENRPRARMLATMFTDPVTNQIILAGGIGRPGFDSPFERYEDQWRFDGSKWVEMNPTQKLPQRYGAQVAVDPVGNRVLVFGGKSSQEEYLNDLWSWDGTRWSEVSDLNPPAPRMNGRMAWDPSTQTMVLYGGYAGIYYSELWSFDGTSWRRIETEYQAPRRRVGRPGSGATSTGGLGAVEVSPAGPPAVSPRPSKADAIR